jgi:hypothetical protein
MTRIDAVAAETVIEASPQQVWDVLTDFAAYAQWNPFIINAAGSARVGERFTATFRPAGSRGTRIRPRILRAEPGRELRWKGSVVVPGLFDGEHAFTLTPTADGGTHLRQEENFTGVLVPLFRSTFTATEQSFVAMNEALRDRVRRRAEAGR